MSRILDSDSTKCFGKFPKKSCDRLPAWEIKGVRTFNLAHGELLALDFGGLVSDKRDSSDFDFDGIPNLVEYVLNGDPARASTTILPTISKDGNDFVFRFNRLVSSANDTTQLFQYSTDMIDWTPVNISNPTAQSVVVGMVNEDGTQSVTVTVPVGENPNLFGRLLATRP